MNLGRYQLLAQLGAGTDGVSYRGADPGKDSTVEIRVLSGARADDNRWKALTKRLRLAAMMEEAAALRLQESALDHDPPFVVLEWLEAPSLADAVSQDLPLPLSTVVQLANDLSAILLSAHRLGLVHGQLCPGKIRLTDTGQVKIDFTGIAANAATLETSIPDVDASCRPPETAAGKTLDPAADVYSLGAILFWLHNGNLAQASSKCLEDSTALESVLFATRHFKAPVDACFQELLQLMLAADPSDRPTMKAVANRLVGIVGPSEIPAKVGEGEPTPQWSQIPKWSDDLDQFERLGRFRLLERLGEGGLGRVYRGEDLADGTSVAIKVLRDQFVGHRQALWRFRKEARLLAEVNNPYVANLIEVNEDAGIQYLVLEFIAGQSLGKLLDERGPLEEPQALAIMADVARALVDAHRKGIIHRDIKPGNIMLVGTSSKLENRGLRIEDRKKKPIMHAGSTIEDRSPNQEGGLSSCKDSSAAVDARSSILDPRSSILESAARVKLCDFGLARHVVETASLNITQEGSTLGTALYMSPEQAAGRPNLDPRTDIYAMGATLFHLLAGRPPFLGDNTVALGLMHMKDPPPPLQKLNSKISDGACRVVEKALAKNPEARYADAAAMLVDLERLLRGEPTSIQVHPRLPECPPGKLWQFDWVWDLEAPPERLWPHVSNTERLNRAVGIPAVEFTAEPDPAGGSRRFGKFRKAGFTNIWREHPFEWIEGRRMGVLREYSQGVFKWLATMTELKPRPGGGTTLLHQVRIEPRNWLGKMVAAVEVGVKGRRIVERVYRRIDAYVTGLLASPSQVSLSSAARTTGYGQGDGGGTLADPFEKTAALSHGRRRRLEQLLDKLIACRVDPAVAEQLGAFLLNASDQDVARIRPLALARRLGLDRDQVVAACLHGAREGLLILLWDILCPICRIPAGIQDTLRALADHGHCPACNLDFELDFANSVELIFRVHPEIRGSELGTYCIGGPVHFPHVAAQVRLAPGEPFELDLSLAEGTYRLRGPQLPFVLDFEVLTGAALTRWDIVLGAGQRPDVPPLLQAGRQLLVLSNNSDQELLVRIERTTPRADALTAARASTLALFRELFPNEVLSPGQLASISTVTLLVTDLDQAGQLYEKLGDAQAFAVLHEHFRFLDEWIRKEGGALVKTLGEGVVAAFPDPLAAVRLGLFLQLRKEPIDVRAASVSERSPPRTPPLQIRIGVHRGSALAATINDRLDYFGTTVAQAVRLPQMIQGGEMVLTQAVAADPQVAALLQTQGLQVEVLDTNLPGQPETPLHRVRLVEPSA
jgi:serine/threonine protein kinase/class 3 adenylate cyclase